jgi:phage shock protein PspC (stress-responsive transcriptional regulator)
MTDDTSNIEQPEGQDRPQDEAPTQPTESQSEAQRAPQPRRLRRSSSDRVLAGVSGGLGSYFGVDPVIFRIGFALSVFFGGIGAVAYLLLAVFVPTDGDPDRAQRIGARLQRAGIWRGLGIVALALVAICGLFALAGGAAFAVALGWGAAVAIAIIAIGVLVAVTGFRGGARWLIAPAVALAIGAGVAAASDLDVRGGIGQREYHPVSASAIPTDGYRLGVGQLIVDVRDVEWRNHQVVELDVDLGIGQASVFVPEDVCVTGSTHVGAGESEVAGERNEGADVDNSVGAGSTATPRLDIDAGVDVGQLRVINSDTASVDTPGYGPGPFHEDTAPQRAAEASACAVE